jgi:hypothetical protein
MEDKEQSSMAGAAKGGDTKKTDCLRPFGGGPIGKIGGPDQADTAASIPPLTAPAPQTDELHAEWTEAYLAFKGAFDTPQMRLRMGDDYSNDARARLRQFDEHMKAAPAPLTDELHKRINAHCNDLLDCAGFLQDDGRNYPADEIRRIVADLRELAKAVPAAPAPEWFKYDAESDVAEIYGMKYARGLFEEVAGTLPLDTAFKVTKRENGVLTVMQVSAPAAPVQTRETDLSKRLRAKAGQPFGPEDFVLLTQAAEEIERYYGGMLAWKKTAEKKDRDWNAERMGRIDDRIAARVAAPVQAEQAQAELTAILFDGKAVYDEVQEHAACRTRTSPENVADALDAVVRLMRKDGVLPAQAEQVEAVRAAYENAENIARCYDLGTPDGHAIADAIKSLATKEAAAQVPSQWISVEDRLPELWQTVALLDENRWMNTGSSDHNVNWHGAGYLCEFGQKYWSIFGEMRSQCLEAVTHWMPLPAAPSTTPSNDTSALGDTGGAK